MKNKLLYLIIAAILLSSCAVNHDHNYTNIEPAGFFLGLWHGLILPFSFVATFFSNDVSLYESIHNGTYNIGYVLGLLILFNKLYNKKKRD